MLLIIYKILPLFLLIVLGALFGWINTSFGQKTVSELNRFAYYVGFPSIIINSFVSIESIPQTEINISLINLGILLLFFLAVWLLVGRIFKDKSIQNTYLICVFFGNVAYLGFPLISALNDGYASRLSLHIAAYLLILFTLGIARLEFVKNSGKLELNRVGRAIFLNPLLLATLIGIMIPVLGIRIPEIGKEVIGMAAGSASPVVLFALGIFISQQKIVRKSLLHATAISAVKLLVFPMICWICAISFFSSYDMTVSIIMSAMPVAITPFVLAEIYDMDKEAVAGAIVISTIASVLVLPLVIGFVG